MQNECDMWVKLYLSCMIVQSLSVSQVVFK